MSNWEERRAHEAANRKHLDEWYAPQIDAWLDRDRELRDWQPPPEHSRELAYTDETDDQWATDWERDFEQSAAEHERFLGRR